MRCPKCGAFMEEGKDVCNMCGTNVQTYVPTQNVNSNVNRDANFGSGNDFRNPAMGNEFQKTTNFNDYKKAEIAPLKKEDKDIFDCYSEHKTIINAVLIVLLFALIGFIGIRYYNSKNKEVALEPVFSNLYYVIDESLVATSSSNNTMTYSKSGEKGNACSITITYGTSTSGDHVQSFFTERKTALAPELDTSANVVNSLDIYTSSEGSLVLDETTWYYLNIFYQKDETSDATLLRYKYLTSMYKGYYYDIELVNNSNDSLCNASLDNFARSLKFIES